jgi:hypothetical protein
MFSGRAGSVRRMSDSCVAGRPTRVWAIGVMPVRHVSE